MKMLIVHDLYESVFYVTLFENEAKAHEYLRRLFGVTDLSQIKLAQIRYQVHDVVMGKEVKVTQ